MNNMEIYPSECCLPIFIDFFYMLLKNLEQSFDAAVKTSSVFVKILCFKKSTSPYLWL